DFHAIADGDWALGKDHETANEIARDVLQAEADTHANRSGKDGERTEVNAGVVQNNEDADDKDDIAHDLRDRVLQRTIETALGEEAIEKKTFCARGKPEDANQQRDQQKNLKQAEVNGG